MISDKINPTDGVQLARDLRAIRENRGVTIDEMHALTRIAHGVLVDFEKDALFGHPMFNTVYLRSLVRSYADATDVPAAEALDCLEQALIGMYRGALAKKYVSGGGAGRRQQDDPASTDADEVGEDSAKDPTPPSAPIAKNISSLTISDGVLSGVSHSDDSASSSGLVLQPSSIRTAAMLVGAIGLLAILAYVAWRLFGPDPNSQPDGPGQSAPDQSPAIETLISTPPPAVAIATPSAPALGEVIRVSVTPIGAPLRPVRVKVDNDLRRPYWIPKDSARVFEFANQIAFDDHLGILEVELEGYAYPTGDLTAGIRFVISRDAAQAFFDSMPGR